MKSAKQNYITIGSDGTVLPQGKPRKAAELSANRPTWPTALPACMARRGRRFAFP